MTHTSHVTKHRMDATAPHPIHTPQGVTHISHVTKYPMDATDDTPERWVAHFAHPLELELLSRGAVPPNRYPNMLLQVQRG